MIILTNDWDVLLIAPTGVQCELLLERSVKLLFDLASRGQSIIELRVDGVVRATLLGNAW